ncbi:hypothetical protein L1049_010591 [Liquidambar formosana]|uniref:RING-type domain-containing protein n=1 Tax=Liquidambar formosana TaxID=63359 RepID=A0AAP0N7Z1_LIQFO
MSGESVFGLQESAERESEVRALVWFLRERMAGVERGNRRWKTLKERLGLKGMACCGGTWGLRPTTMSIIEEEDDDDDDEIQQQEEEHHRRQIEEAIDVGQIPAENSWDPECVGQIPAGSGMNLATALAAERHFRSTQDSEGGEGAAVGPTGTTSTAGTAPGTPLRVSLMRLLEETNGVEGEMENGAEGEVGSDSVCCVCMGRKKGAAFIPCGHTFCRVCSRELWLNRGSCPLCNRSILEILDIF